VRRWCHPGAGSSGSAASSAWTFEFGQVFVDGGLQDDVSGVEVAVGEVIAHAGDLAPWNGGLDVIQPGRCLGMRLPPAGVYP
jgi:hypothetical protein